MSSSTKFNVKNRTTSQITIQVRQKKGTFSTLVSKNKRGYTLRVHVAYKKYLEITIPKNAIPHMKSKLFSFFMNLLNSSVHNWKLSHTSHFNFSINSKFPLLKPSLAILPKKKKPQPSNSNISPPTRKKQPIKSFRRIKVSTPSGLSSIVPTKPTLNRNISSPPSRKEINESSRTKRVSISTTAVGTEKRPAVIVIRSSSYRGKPISVPIKLPYSISVEGMSVKGYIYFNLKISAEKLTTQMLRSALPKMKFISIVSKIVPSTAKINYTRYYYNFISRVVSSFNKGYFN